MLIVNVYKRVPKLTCANGVPVPVHLLRLVLACVEGSGETNVHLALEHSIHVTHVTHATHGVVSHAHSGAHAGGGGHGRGRCGGYHVHSVHDEDAEDERSENQRSARMKKRRRGREDRDNVNRGQVPSRWHTPEVSRL